VSTMETPHPPQTPEFAYVTPGGPTHVYEPNGCMHVKKFSVGPFDNNVYVVHCTGTNKALIVDGASDPDRILREVEGMDVVGIVETHGHPDHVQALPKLVEALGAPVYAHGDDASKMPVPTKPLRGGETMSVGDVDVTVLHTPGHTPGSLSFVARGHLFSGDTLFPGGPGNTNNKRPQFDEIMRSVDRLFELPDDTRVSPGHGLDSSIGRERPHVETWRARGW
jgi:glyoxylase-like metal-dependent hydrolase (beta-lactamase superfamily II)